MSIRVAAGNSEYRTSKMLRMLMADKTIYVVVALQRIEVYYAVREGLSRLAAIVVIIEYQKVIVYLYSETAVI